MTASLALCSQMNGVRQCRGFEQKRIILNLVIIAGTLCLAAFVIQTVRHLKPVEIEEKVPIIIPNPKIQPAGTE